MGLCCYFHGGERSNHLSDGLFLLDGLKTQLVLVGQDGIDSADLEELDVSDGFVEVELFSFSVALPGKLHCLGVAGFLVAGS